MFELGIHSIARLLRPLRWAGQVLLWMWLAMAVQAETTAKVGWDANEEPDLAGYRVYWGTESGNYTQAQDVGLTTRTVITGLTEGTTYYLTVTAYNAYGIESTPAQEIVFTPAAKSRLSWESTQDTAPQTEGAPARLRLQGQAGQRFEIQATSDLIAWEPLGTVTLTGAEGWFSDPEAGSVAARFYRARLLP